MTRPALPRTSSATSGFFFCGIIDDPVANASGSRRNPNSLDDHSTISSPRRDRCTWASAAANTASATKSRSETASSEFSNRRANPSVRAVCSGSSGRLEPARAPAPSGDTSAATDHPLEPLDVTTERPGVREQVVREQHRLGVLQVRVARARRRRRRPPRPGVTSTRCNPSSAATSSRAGALGPEPQVGRDLVVATPPGVQLGAGVAGQLGDPPLDRGVDVLVRGREHERVGGELGLDRVERGRAPPAPLRRSAGPPRPASRRARAEPSTSSAASRRSNDRLSESAISASSGPSANRPCHSVPRSSSPALGCTGVDSSLTTS